MSWRLSELSRWCDGVVQGEEDALLERISTDSRTLQRGDLFVALRGERFDGHGYLEEAVARGAHAVMISQSAATSLPVPAIRVKDTVRALGDLARRHRERFTGPVVAITGSNGKTTTKELCSDILESAGVRVRRSPGNLNNQIGLPLSILGLEPEDQALVLELGMNHAGEIDALARIAQPQVGAITQVAPAHIGLLGSLEAIARAKGELLDHIRSGGTAVLNADDPQVMAQRERFAGRCVRFGFAADAEFRAEWPDASARDGFRLSTPDGSCRVALRLPGRHLVEDALCAAAAAWASGLLGNDVPGAIRRGLEGFRGLEGRLALREALGDVRLLDDSYNSNPDSVRAALATLCQIRGDGRAVAVLGDMLELGSDADALHRAVGREAAEAGVEMLIAVGPLSTATAAAAREAGIPIVEAVPDTDAAVSELRALVRAGDVVLIKASRGMRLERVTRALLEEV